MSATADSRIKTSNRRKWQEVLDNILTECSVGTAAACCCPSPSASGLSCAQTGSGMIHVYSTNSTAKAVSYCFGGDIFFLYLHTDSFKAPMTKLYRSCCILYDFNKCYPLISLTVKQLTHSLYHCVHQG